MSSDAEITFNEKSVREGLCFSLLLLCSQNSSAYSRSSYSELWSFSISRFLPTAHLSISVISLSVFITAPLLILVTLPSALLLVKGDRTADSPFVSSIGLSTIHSSAVIDYGQNVK